MSEQPGHWFEPIADHLGSAYLRYSFTRGTEQEVGHLVGALGLEPGDRVLDVGCGPGRHAHALARLGMEVVGIDISERFVSLARQDAPPGCRFERQDARHLRFDAEFDAAISLCQGAFGLAGAIGGRAQPDGPGWTDPDGAILERIARSLRPGGGLALSAFSAYFQVRYLEDGDSFEADAGVNHEKSVVRDEQGVESETDLWTSCFTPRELRLLCSRAGIEVGSVSSVTPGNYRDADVDLDHPEFLVIGRRSAQPTD